MVRKKQLVCALALIFLYALAPAGVRAQLSQENDSLRALHFPAHSFVMMGDSTIYIESDTTLYLPDSLYHRFSLRSDANDSTFYQSIRDKYGTSKWTRKLVDMLFASPGRSVRQQTKKDYAVHAGRRIDSIRIVRLKPLGTSLADTAQMLDMWAIRAANSIHTRTRERIVSKNLLFSAGDEVNVDEVADSERIIRNLPYVKDARIFIHADSSAGGGVTAVVVIKDLWSIVPRIDYDGLDDFELGAADINFLGLGHELEAVMLYDQRFTPTIGLSSQYRINNIWGTFTNFNSRFVTSALQEEFSLELDKQFLTPETRYGGGVISTWNKETLRVPLDYDLRDTVRLVYNRQDVWVGRAFHLPEKYGFRKNIGITGRIFRNEFIDRPEVQIDTNRFYINRHQYLLGLSYNGVRYTKDQYIVGYGRTEDVPSGYSFSLLWGRDVNEFNNRHYVGTRLSAGDYIRKIGYARFEVALGSYRRQGQWEQGALQVRADYFTQLYYFHSVRFRQLAHVTFVKGYNRFKDEYLNIREIHGFADTLVRGDVKLAFSTETLIFSPFNFYGFNFTFFANIEMGLIAKSPDKLFGSKLYQGYGLGVRFRNENLAIQSFQIRLNWYPVNTPFQEALSLEVSRYDELLIEDFRISKPAIIAIE
jgi:hypothetical protein